MNAPFELGIVRDYPEHAMPTTGDRIIVLLYLRDDPKYERLKMKDKRLLPCSHFLGSEIMSS